MHLEGLAVPIQWILLGVLLFFSGLFSASETALTSLGKLRMKAMLERDEKRKKTMRLWANDPNRFLAAILVGNNFVNIAASILAAFLAVSIYGRSLSAGLAWGVTGVMTFVILIFCEVTPKMFARQNAEKIALKTIVFLRVVSYVLSPLIRLLLYLSKGIIKMLGGKILEHAPFMTEEEMKTLIGLGEEEGVIQEDEREMLESIFEFGDMKVKELMIPRTDMVCVEAGAKLDRIISLFVKEGCSRIPVYEGRLDNVIGFLYAKDLLKFWDRRGGEELVLADFIRQPYLVPETKKVNELLREFQRNRIHIAIVVDEYGGTAGLVTIEDLIEEIVGEIEDEYDIGGDKIKYLEHGEALVDASIDIGELNEKMRTSFPEQEGIETLAGFIISLLGRVAAVGDVIEYKDFKINIVEATKKRIGKVKITRTGGVKQKK